MSDAPKILLAAFGKHPGWNDHIDDLGMETASVVMVKRKLYFEGFAANIDTGKWENDDAGQVLPEFEHEFIWQVSGSNICGRFWSSRDGKGRGRYPMILCAQAFSTPALWMIESAIAALEQAEDECKAASSADQVRGVLDTHRARLRERLVEDCQEGGAQSDLFMAGLQLNMLINAPSLGGDRSGIYRLLYRLDRDVPGFLKDGRGPRNPDIAIQLRVPHVHDRKPESMLLWLAFFRALLRPDIPLMLLHSRQGNWHDIILGNPATPQFQCLKAGPQSVPMTTDIPYNFDAAFVSQADDRIDAIASTSQPVWDAMLDDGASTSGIERAKTQGGGFLGGIKDLFGGRR